MLDRPSRFPEHRMITSRCLVSGFELPAGIMQLGRELVEESSELGQVIVARRLSSGPGHVALLTRVDDLQRIEGIVVAIVGTFTANHSDASRPSSGLRRGA
jgi:hypothetical protein